MNLDLVLNLLMGAGMVLFGGLALWWKGNGTVRGMAAALIAEAEVRYKDSTKAGGEKFEWVVDRLHRIVPFLPRELVKSLVQSTFDAVERYAALQLDKAVDEVRWKSKG